MKKFALYAAVLVLVSIVAVPSVLAATNSDKTVSEFFKSMFDSHRSQLDRSLEEGEITQEQADKWNEHFDYMQKFHEENGFGPGMMGNNRHCATGDYDNSMMGDYPSGR